MNTSNNPSCCRRMAGQFFTIISLTGLALLFQNCGNSMKASQTDGESSLTRVSRYVPFQIASHSAAEISGADGDIVRLFVEVENGTDDFAIEWFKGSASLGKDAVIDITLSSASVGRYTARISDSKRTEQLSFDLTIEVTPLPPPQVNTKSILLLGTNKKIRRFEFDHATETLTDNGTVNTSANASWMTFDQTENKVFVGGSSAAGIEVFQLSSAPSPTLTSQKTVTSPVNNMAHLTVAKISSEWLLFSSGTSTGKLGYSRLSVDLNEFQNIGTTSFAATARTHSTAFDADRGLVFVANMGAGKIEILKVTATALVSVGSFAVNSPRSVVYDPTYKKLFLATEGVGAASEFKVFNVVVQNSNSVALTVSGTVTMGERASTLSVNTSRAIAAVGVRTDQVVQLIPLTSDGKLDSTRTALAVPVPAIEARSVQLSEDGGFLFVTPNHTLDSNPDLLIYRISYGAGNRVTAAQLIKSVNAGTTGFQCMLAIAR